MKSTPSSRNVLCVAAAVLLASSTGRGPRGPEPEHARAPQEARERAQAFFEDDKPRRAVASLAAAARQDPSDRKVGSMLYASIRDHVWHLPQTLPVQHGGAV